MNKRRINSWLSVIEASADEPVQLLIYDKIGEDFFGTSGVNARDFAQTLSDIPFGRRILVAINSPGGNVWDGVAIYHQLEQRHAYVTTRVDGVAASIASVIACAGSRMEMPENSRLMVHDPWGMVAGNAKDLRQFAEQLDRTAEAMAGIYAGKTGKSRDAMRDLMKAETWLSGSEAHAAGFADTVTTEAAMAACFDFSAYRRVPEGLLVNPGSVNNPASEGGANPNNAMNRTAILALLKKHGVTVAEDAADNLLVAYIDSLVAIGKVTAEERKKLLGDTPVAVAAPAPQAATASVAAPAPAAPAAPAATPPAAAQVAQPPAPAAPAASQAAIDPQRLERLEASYREERTRRITAEFNTIADANATLDTAYWLPRVLADEGLMAGLRAMAPEPGPAIARPGRIRDLGNPMLNEYRGMQPGAQRMAHRVLHFAELTSLFRRHLPAQAANTLSASLVPDFLADSFVSVANNRLAALAVFSRNFGVSRLAPRQTVQVPKFTATSAAQTDPSNFETGDTTATNIAVAVHQISKSFHITNDQINSGFQLQQMAEINADTFANAISDIWTALVLSATYGSLTVGASTNFDVETLKDILGDAKNFRVQNVALDGAYIARLLPVNLQGFTLGTPGIFGFNGRIAAQNRWTSATANTVGFSCGPDAIAVGSGLPLDPANSFEFMSVTQVDLPDLGLSVEVRTWFSRAGRVMWASYDVMFGAAAGDSTQGTVLISA